MKSFDKTTAINDLESKLKQHSYSLVYTNVRHRQFQQWIMKRDRDREMSSQANEMMSIANCVKYPIAEIPLRKSAIAPL